MAWNYIFLLFNTTAECRSRHSQANIVNYTPLFMLVPMFMSVLLVFLLLQSIFFNQLNSLLTELVSSYNPGDIRIWQNAKRIWGGVVGIPERHLAGHQAEELSEGTFFDRKALVWSPVIKVKDYEDECGFSERIWGITCQSTNRVFLPLKPIHVLALPLVETPHRPG